jgi:hypothetical protein
MDYLGVIVGPTNGTPVDQQAWVALIDQHPNLVRPQPVPITNPFTRKPAVMRPRRDIAGVVVDGEPIGTIEWFQDGENGMLVMGNAAVVPIAEVVATALGAMFRRKGSELA